MGGYLEKALSTIKRYIIGWFLVSGVLLIALWWLADRYLKLDPILLLALLLSAWVSISYVVGAFVARQTSAPLKALAKAILHVSPSPIPIAAPDVESLELAKDLVANLTRQVYEYAAGTLPAGSEVKTISDNSLQQLPIAVIGLDHNSNVTFANPKAVDIGKFSEGMIGKSIYALFDLLFKEQGTLQEWVAECDEKSITAQKTWLGIRLSSYDKEPQYFDMAASYKKSSTQGETEVILVLFDQNDLYGEEDNELSFIALAVHELRTPLTILRGYIEAFDDEIGDQLTPELKNFMLKMQASAENLTAFVGNILNVAKIEQNQLSLKLFEEEWGPILTKIVSDMQLRARVHDKKIELVITPNLPKVGIDRISLAEVMTNLLDNAIKYSPQDKTQIRVESKLNTDGLIETTVQDFGVGVPTQVMPHLFEKFSRNYRNRASIGGTGLGLYLSKALITAHGGNIWVRSREGEGSTFGFTVLPYDKLAEKEKNTDNKEITRSAHGWIKNHSLTRR